MFGYAVIRPSGLLLSGPSLRHIANVSGIHICGMPTPHPLSPWQALPSLDQSKKTSSPVEGDSFHKITRQAAVALFGEVA
jgi:hypothetical protein